LLLPSFNLLTAITRFLLPAALFYPGNAFSQGSIQWEWFQGRESFLTQGHFQAVGLAVKFSPFGERQGGPHFHPQVGGGL
jgi:hypothetical protein